MNHPYLAASLQKQLKSEAILCMNKRILFHLHAIHNAAIMTEREGVQEKEVPFLYILTCTVYDQAVTGKLSILKNRIYGKL